VIPVFTIVLNPAADFLNGALAISLDHLAGNVD
jgi:hypothetical protein